MKKAKALDVCLHVTSFNIVLSYAKHFFGSMFLYDVDFHNKEAYRKRWELRRKITKKEAAKWNKQDDSYVWEAGDSTNRFNSHASIERAAIKFAKEKWGNNINIYLGDRGYDFQDMDMIYPKRIVRDDS